MKNESKKRGMNLPNKITCVRLVISLIVLIILCLPWSELGVEFPIYNIFGVENVDLKYIICGILFLIGSVTDFLDGYIARKYNLVTDFGKVMDAIADKVLVNGVLIILAYDKLSKLSLDEKIGQLLLVRYPGDDKAVSDIVKYKFGGFVFYEKDFKDKTVEEVKEMVNRVQKLANIPILTAVDEEGGKVVRISSNPKLATSKFKSSQELYNIGGFQKITEDTIDKSKLLNKLGINLNLAPVVDVAPNTTDYMYERSLGKDTKLTSTYAKTVIEASKGTGVSYTLKHFPGYGNNKDTHLGSSVDNRTYDDILKNDLPPFKEGIRAQAEAVLVLRNLLLCRQVFIIYLEMNLILQVLLLLMTWQ